MMDRAVSQPAPSFGVVSTTYPAEHRWRCATYNRGFGTVVGALSAGGVVWSYRVELDSGDDATMHPYHVRRVANLHVVRP